MHSDVQRRVYYLIVRISRLPFSARAFATTSPYKPAVSAFTPSDPGGSAFGTKFIVSFSPPSTPDGKALLALLRFEHVLSPPLTPPACTARTFPRVALALALTLAFALALALALALIAEKVGARCMLLVVVFAEVSGMLEPPLM